MEKVFELKSIGVIRTPYRDTKGMPIQGTFDKKALGRIEIFSKYQKGLKDLDGFSHLIVIYYFDRAKKKDVTAQPFLENKSHGIFAIRSPYRPNHLGFSVVKIEDIKKNIITFSEVDVLDKTPVLDIKPYISYFDCRKKVKNGWLEKHFKSGKISRRVRL